MKVVILLHNGALMLMGGVITIISIGLQFPFAQAQSYGQAGLLYCCNDDRGLRICGDRPSYCWGKQYDIVNRDGIRIKQVGPALTQEEMRAKVREENRQLRLKEEQERQEEQFHYLRGLYGSTDNIDKEIERQKREHQENIKITQSRLQTSKDNVNLFKAQKNNKLSEEDRKVLARYEQTVTDIETELLSRKLQHKNSIDRLLKDKESLIKFSRPSQ